MTYATLMAFIDEGEASEALAGFACDLADRFRSHLIGIGACPPRVPLADPFFAGPVAGEGPSVEREIAQAAIRRAEERFRAAARLRQRSVEWRGVVDDPARAIARECRAADLVLIRHPDHPGRPGYADVGDVVMSAGRPVLVVPPGPAPTLAAERVVVGWKENRESRRAVADALPFLKAAAQVDIVEICEDGGVDVARARTADVAAHLRRHEVRAVPMALFGAAQAVGERLLAFARQERADLVVMGGYGHARVRNWTLGGVTAEMLRGSPVCCLISN